MLQKLLESIPERLDLEVIVVDDNSNQEVELLQQLQENGKHSRVQFYVNHTGKKGAGVARNVGLSHAVGEWLLFADADDCFVEGFYEIVQKHMDDGVELVFFPPTSRDLDRGQLSNRHLFFEQLVMNYVRDATIEAELKLRYSYHSPWSKMVRRSLIVEYAIEFDDSFVANDIMYSVKIGYYSKGFAVSDKIIYCIHTHGEGLTRNLTEEKFDIRLQVEMNKYEFLRQRLRTEELKLLDINILQYLTMLREHRLGKPSKYITTFSNLKRRGIPLVEKNLRSPGYIMEKVAARFQ